MLFRWTLGVEGVLDLCSIPVSKKPVNSPNSRQLRALHYEVKTWWRSLQDFEDWTQSPAFAAAGARQALHDTFVGPELLDVHEVFLESPRSTLR